MFCKVEKSKEERDAAVESTTGGGGLLVEVFDANVDVFHSVSLCPLLILWSHYGVHQLA